MDEIFEQSILILSMLMTATSAVYLLWVSFGTFSSSNSKHLQIVGQIIGLKEDAKRKESENFEWDDVRTNERAFNKDTIFTGSHSELSLKLKTGGTIKIGPNTLIFLSQDVTGSQSGKSNLTEISLVRGNLDYSGDNTSSHANPISINLGKAKVSSEVNSNYQIVRNADEAQVISKSGQVQIAAGSGPNEQKISLAPNEGSTLKNISSDSSKNTDLEKQTKIVPIQPQSMSDTSHVAVRGDISQVTREVPALSESSLFGKSKPTVAATEPVAPVAPVAIAPPVPVPVAKATPKPKVAKKIVAPPSIPLVAVKPKPVAKTAPVAIPQDTSGISGKAIVSQGGFQLEPTAEAKFAEKLNPINFAWKTDLKEMGKFSIQFSTAANFDSNIMSYKIGEDELVATKGDKASYTLDFEPNKFSHLKGFLEGANKNRFLFWRIVPVDDNGTPQGSLQALPIQKMTFKYSPKADIKSSIGMYSEPSDSNSIVIAKWTMKNVIPSQYQITLAASADLSNSVCQKTITKDVFQGSKGKGPISLVFNEQAILENSDDCKIDELLKAKKKLYFGVTALDISGQTIQFSNPAKALGSLNLQ